MLTADDMKYIRQRTGGSMNRQGKTLNRMYDEKGTKGRKMTISPGITFIRAR